MVVDAVVAIGNDDRLNMIGIKKVIRICLKRCFSYHTLFRMLVLFLDLFLCDLEITSFFMRLCCWFCFLINLFLLVSFFNKLIFYKGFCEYCC